MLCKFGFVMEYFGFSIYGNSEFCWLYKHLCSLRVCMTSVHDVMAFIVSGEKSGVILIGPPLYVT